MTKKDQLFVDSEYLFMIQSFNIKLERVTERGCLKQFPLEMIDDRFGRSINQFIHINITFHFQWTRWIIFISCKCPITKINVIQIRKIYSLFIQIKYLISLLIRNNRMLYHLIQWNSNVEDLFIINTISILPLITNEE